MDEQTNEQPAEQSAPQSAAEPAPEHYGQTFALAFPLDHNRVRHAAGETVPGSLFSVEEFQTLRREGLLKFEHEVAAAEDVARELVAKSAALAEARAELERVRAQLEAATRGAGRK